MQENKKKLIFGSGVSSFKDVEGLKKMCSVAIDNGIMAFDTAPSYHTEEALSEALLQVLNEAGKTREQIHIQTKIDPIQMYHGQVEKYFEEKLNSMHLDYVDALLIHWPIHTSLCRTWEELKSIKRNGLARKIGICNLRISHLRELKGIGVIPEILQIERHPLNTFMEEVRFCEENNITLQDYSPLCKMHPLLRDNMLLKEMSERYGESVGSIILKWHIDTGAVPIFTSKNPGRIAEYSNIDSFQLSNEDIEKITSLNINHKLYLESLVCAGF